MSALIHRIKSLLPQGRFARSVAVLAGGTAAGQALLVLVSPLLTRLYSPEDFGVFTVYTSSLAVLLVIASLLYDMAIPLPEEDVAAADLLALSLLNTVLVSALTALVVWLFGDVITARMSVPGLRPYLWLLPVSLFGAGIYQALCHWAVRKKEFGKIAKTKMSQSLGLLSVQVSLGLFKIVPGGLFIGDAIGRAVGSGTLIRLIRREDRSILQNVSWRGMMAVAKRYKKFPLYTGPSALLNMIGLHLPILLLTAFFGPHVVGLFALAQRVFGVPLQVIGASVAEVFFSEAAGVKQEEPRALLSLYWRTVKHMLLIGLPVIVLAAVFSPWAFSWVFGGEWGEAGLYVRLLSLMFLFQLAANAISATVIVLERQDLHLIRELCRIVILTVAVLLAQGLGATPTVAVWLFSLAGAVSYGIYAFVAWLAIKQFLARTDSEVTS